MDLPYHHSISKIYLSSYKKTKTIEKKEKKK